MGTGFLVGLIVAGVLGILFGVIIASLQKHVHKKNGKIDFSKTNLYFYWSRWDYVMIASSAYSIICITGLFYLVVSGEDIQNPFVQFFLHQTFIFPLLTFLWFIFRLAYTYKGIKERWPNEF
ncbi:hypothetical protein Q9251_00570 [Alkalihalobacillus macyae]|uniref:hypothetical protein n=1 Tax=Guptibacillus hwajinpoensis TaxID=208199 RepID=UPI00273AECE5|nr:hypothetical protein [Alkalihalobacillus macyae]MDP4549368.1 hypothetical protein [Alkalihalobacillus macyae]